MEKLQIAADFCRALQNSLSCSLKYDRFSFSHSKINSQDQFFQKHLNKFFSGEYDKLKTHFFFCMHNSTHKLSKFVSGKQLRSSWRRGFNDFGIYMIMPPPFVFVVWMRSFRKQSKFCLSTSQNSSG